MVLLEVEAIGLKVDDDLQRSKAGKQKDPDFRLQKGKEEAEQNDRKEKAGKVSKTKVQTKNPAKQSSRSLRRLVMNNKE